MANPPGVYNFDVEEDRKREQAQAESRFNMSETGAPDLGMTTDTPDQHELRNLAVREAAIQAADEAAGVTPQTPDEVERLKKIIGDQGNEIGELRRTAEKAAVLEGQVQTMQEQWNQAQAQQRQVQPTGQTFDVFDGIPDEQLYDPQVMRRTMSAKFMQLAQATQAELDKVRADAQYFAARQASGVDSGREAELIREHPWLARMTGTDKAEAIAEMARTKTASEGAPQKTADEAARLAARRSSYTEPSGGVSEEASEANLEPAAEKLLRRARSGQIKSAEESAKELRKIGVMNYDSYGQRY